MKICLLGRTDSNKVVVFKPEKNICEGDFVDVKITHNHKWYLEGVIL